jgi:hypothetical protein
MMVTDFPPAPQWFGDILAECREAMRVGGYMQMSVAEWRESARAALAADDKIRAEIARKDKATAEWRDVPPPPLPPMPPQPVSQHPNAPRRQRKARSAPPDGLRTSAEAAARLGCSIKTLNGHIASGTLRYVITGHGNKRPRRMFTDGDLNTFIANQTRKDSPCPSTASRARHSGTSTSTGEVIAFTARPKQRPGAKRRK